MKITPRNSDVLFVGAGPVGLWSAIQTKILNPKLEVCVIDRLSEYARPQTLSIDPASFNQVYSFKKLKKLRPENLETIKKLENFVAEFKKPKRIPINVLQKQLEEICLELNIDIEKNHAFLKQSTHAKTETETTVSETLDDLKKAFPKAKVIVGSDGSRSAIRETVFANEMAHETPMQYTVAFKFYVKGPKVKKMPPLPKIHGKIGVIRTMKPVEAVQHGYIEEHIGRKIRIDKDGKADENGEEVVPITVQFFVSKQTHDLIEKNRAGNPLTSREDIPEEIRNLIDRWQEVRRHYNKETYHEAFGVYTIMLSSYASRFFVKREGKITYCLVGDSAFGVPYFRSINNGLACGSKLAQTIVKSLTPDALPKNRSLINKIKRVFKRVFPKKTKTIQGTGKKQKRWKSYAHFTSKLQKRENKLAKSKNSGLKALKTLGAAVRFLPWNLGKWKALPPK